MPTEFISPGHGHHKGRPSVQTLSFKKIDPDSYLGESHTTGEDIVQTAALSDHSYLDKGNKSLTHLSEIVKIKTQQQPKANGTVVRSTSSTQKFYVSGDVVKPNVTPVNLNGQTATKYSAPSLERQREGQGRKSNPRTSENTQQHSKRKSAPKQILTHSHHYHKTSQRYTVQITVAQHQGVTSHKIQPIKKQEQRLLPRRQQADVTSWESQNGFDNPAMERDPENYTIVTEVQGEEEGVVNHLGDLDLDVMEMDDVQPVIVPLSHEEEYSLDNNERENGKPLYRQNQAAFNNISPRAAKYRDSKLKLPRHITVPHPNGSVRVSSQQTDQRSRSHSPRSHSPSQHGSMRGYPEMGPNVMSRSSSGTLRSLHSGRHESIVGLSSQNGTLRIIQKDAPQPVGPFRSHHLPLGGTVSKAANSVASIALRRGNVRKENLVTQFAIQLDQHDRHRYSPSEEISGQIVFDVCGKLEIRFIEFQIIGQTSVSFARSGAHGYKTFRDTFLNKRSYVVGTPDVQWASMVTPGHYVSKFRFRLPEGIPSSFRYKDDSNGFATEIAYKIKARICDDMGSSSIRSTHSLHNYVKVLLSRQFSFVVKRPFDIHSVPMALTPVTHTETVSLSSCMVFSSDLTSITLSLDRSCFLAGDEIKVQLRISNFTKQIDKIRGELQQNVSVRKPKINVTYVIADFEQTDTKGTLLRDNQQCFELAMPTHTDILPSINPGCRLFGITYNLLVVVHFSSCGGQLSLDVPIRIGPCTDPVNLEKRNSVPVFNRPMRFPYFSPHDNGKIQNGHAQGHMHPVRSGVKSKYSHGNANTSVFCCWASETLM